MTVGNLAALRQQNVKRMLAYSAIAHAGYLLAALAATAPEGIVAGAFYISAYAAMNVGIFAVVALISGYDDELPLIQDFRGLWYRSPVLGGLLTFFLISLVGIPFTGGFFGKFYSFSAAVGGGAVWLAIIGLLNSGVAATYYLRLAFVAAQRPTDDTPALPARTSSIGIMVSAAIGLAAVATLALGIIPGAILNASQSAAHTLQPLPDAPTTEAPATASAKPNP